MPTALETARRTGTKPTDWLHGDRLKMVGIKILLRRRARFARRLAQAALCRQARYARPAVPHRCRAQGPTGRAAEAGSSPPSMPSAMPPTRKSSAAYEELRQTLHGDRRWRIEHVQVVDPADIPRIAKAGIIASMQPTHQTSDRTDGRGAAGPGATRRRLCLEDHCRNRRAPRLRVGFPGRIAQPLPRPRRRGQPPGPGGTTAGRMAARGKSDARPGAGRLHARGGLCRVRRGPAGLARSGALGRLHPRRPRYFDRRADRIAATQVLETWVAGKKVWQRSASAPAERGK